MRICVSADSTCDIPKDLIQKHNIHLKPIAVTIGEEVRYDGIDITPEEVFNIVDTTNVLPKTSAVNSFEYTEYFNKLKQEYDAVIHLSLSFGVSSTGNNARLAAMDLDNVYVIDTKSLSSGSGLLVLSCVDKVNEGKDVKTIVEELEQEAEKIQASFLVDTLKYLHKGGRCSSLALLGANLLKLKPRISLVDGKMQVTKKYRGKIEDALIKYFEDLIEEIKPNKKRVFITYSSPVEPTREIIKQRLIDMGFEEVLESMACATISTHCGPKTMGVLYMGE
ncbi:MAG: DegV family protein [Clostridia bacterium]|nr:DegV family protein [Clostridia bacterium]